MKYANGALEVGADHAGKVRVLIEFAADHHCDDSPDGKEASELRELAREGEALVYTPDEVPTLKRIAAVGILRGFGGRASQSGDAAMLANIALNTGLDPVVMDEAFRQFRGDDPEAPKSALAELAACMILIVTASRVPAAKSLNS